MSGVQAEGAAAPALLEQLAAPLRRAGAALDAVVAAYEGLGPVDDLPEPWQVQGFALATLYARLHAAREMQRYGERGGVEAMLAAWFVADTLHGLQAGLPPLAATLGAGEAAAWRPGPEALAAMSEATGPLFNRAVLQALDAQQSFGTDGLDEAHRLLKDSFRTFAERRVQPWAERFHREDRLIPDELIAEAAGLGCFGLCIPERYGGFQEEPDSVGMVLVTEQLCRASLVFGSLITRPEILARALLNGGTEAQRERFLPPMAGGERMVAISVTEPDHGSDVANLSLRARPVDGGWRLSGTKVWSTFAGRAELIGLLARSEPDPSLGHKGLSMFVVEKPPFYEHDFEHAPDGGGRLTGRAIATLGYRGMHSYELSFDDYFVPAENLVGGEAGRGRGFYLQMQGFSTGRLQTAGRALGVMQSAFEHALAYARERRVFGRRLGDYPLTQAKLARMAATIQACRQTTYATARLMDRGGGQMEASLLKFLACRESEWVTREAQQIHGGMGYAEEYEVSRLFVDARVLSIFEGTEEVLALRVILPALLRQAAPPRT